MMLMMMMTIIKINNNDYYDDVDDSCNISDDNIDQAIILKPTFLAVVVNKTQST